MIHSFIRTRYLSPSLDFLLIPRPIQSAHMLVHALAPPRVMFTIRESAGFSSSFLRARPWNVRGVNEMACFRIPRLCPRPIAAEGHINSREGGSDFLSRACEYVHSTPVARTTHVFFRSEVYGGSMGSSSCLFAQWGSGPGVMPSVRPPFSIFFFHVVHDQFVCELYNAGERHDNIGRWLRCVKP